MGKALLGGTEKPLHEWESLSHVRWECKYHVVIVPKYRRKVIYGRLKQEIGKIIRDPLLQCRTGNETVRESVSRIAG